MLIKPAFLSVLVGLLVLFAIVTGKGEGTKELNSNNVQSTSLNLCNDFINHCSSSSGIRSQFATYDNSQSANDVDRLYFVTTNSNEAVYMGFQSGAFSPANPARHIVFRIKNLAGTVVLAEQALPTSGSGYISSFAQALNGPNQLPLPALTNGYNALIFTPPAPGSYFIEFSVRRDDNNNFYTGNFSIALFDLTVGNTVTHSAKPGRLYSKSWQFVESNSFYGKNYIISDDSIVTSAQFSGMQGGRWVQYCNQTGCGNSSANWITSRKSLYNQQALFPQYKIFLNNPDSVVFPSATTLGQIVAPLPYGVQNCTTGHILFHVAVNKPGNVEIILTFPSPFLPRTLYQAVVLGDNLFDWDGLDGTTPTGLVVPNNTMIQFTVKYINGLTNLPLYDVEGNDFGFTISLVKPPGSTPAVYWDDTNIPSGTSNTTAGCTSPPGCHPWASSGGSGFGDQNTINTWWFNVSTTTTPSTIEQYRGPQPLVFLQQPPQVFCQNTGGHVFSVTPEVNSDIYHWSYTPSAGVTISQLSPGSPFVTVTFGASATSGSLQVYGSNANCAMNGPVTSLPITINMADLPANNGPASVCAGQTNVQYITDPGKTNYVWTVSSGGTITAGGTLASNTVTVNWNTAGSQTVSVSYINPVTTCQSPANVKMVTVNARPVPVITGASLVCIGSTGVVYSTAAGKSNYVWSVSTGGTITAGGTSTSNTATVTWSILGAQSISVNYSDPITLCPASSPTQLTVTVNTLPVPTFISSVTYVCQGVPGNLYMTQPGMINYSWSVTGGTITAGGTALSNTATVTWNTPGTQSISVNYTLPFSSCTAISPTNLLVNVNPLPIPSIMSGNNSVCVGASGNTYTTQTGMGTYLWTVSGGNITAGGSLSDNFVTITWNSVGNQSVSINYNNPTTNCMAAFPTVYPVTVKPLPFPVFTAGASSACLNIPGHVYATQPGMSNYTWTITGGVITDGGGLSDNSATVTWNLAGIQSISVSFTDPATLCSAAFPATYHVTVKSLPIPGFIAGDDSICQGSTGNVYATEPGMSAYTWTVTGGTITAGGTSLNNSATVTWNVVGNQQITVTYTDPATTCSAAAPTSMSIVVKPLPVPSISGPDAACLNTSGPQYFTESGMTEYVWLVPGGTITPGPTPDLINVVWNTPGTHLITVNYRAQNGCEPENPAQKSVLVNNLPSPGISGQNVICSRIQTTYTTEQGMQNYVWEVSDAAAIISGGLATDNFLNVKWLTPGLQNVRVNYTLGTGCTAAAPANFAVTVNQSTIPAIEESPSGQNCITFSNTYSTQASMSGYSWTISPGGTITSPVSSNIITVKWNTIGPQWVRANFTNESGCSEQYPTQFDLTVNALPLSTITRASGPDCELIAHDYQAPADPGCDFNWSINPVSSGSVITGQGSNVVAIEWQSTGAATINVFVTNTLTGCSSSSNISTTIYPKPNPQFYPCFDVVTTPNAKKFILKGASPNISGQGVFTGNRVSYDASLGYFVFDPNGAGQGTYTITYTYTNIYGCPVCVCGIAPGINQFQSLVVR